MQELNRLYTHGCLTLIVLLMYDTVNETLGKRKLTFRICYLIVCENKGVASCVVKYALDYV